MALAGAGCFDTSLPGTEYCEFTPAVANAGMDKTVPVGGEVRLDGSRSTGSVLIVYHWKIKSRPSGSQAMITRTASVDPTFTADRLGRYVVELVVTADRCESHPDEVVITGSN